MANPKRRHSKGRRDRRRTHDSLRQPVAATCPNCGAAKLPHRVCLDCGYYRDRQVIEAQDNL